jgi:protein-disulfide isomerase/uncharacterized membrane protein YphA (DoxX/SURF4 family)
VTESPAPDARASASAGDRTSRSAWALAPVLARFALAAVWVYAAVTKIGDADAAVRAVRAYDIVPELLVELLAWGLPAAELALAVLLVTGLAPRAAAWASVAILGIFIAGIASAWARGLQIDCGCFGSGGPADVDGWDYASDIARDLGFVVLALVAALGPDDGFQLRPRLPARLRSRSGQAAILVVTLVVAAALGVAIQDRRSDVGATDAGAPPLQEGTRRIEGTPWTVGRPDAPVVVEVFEDFTCHTCGAFAREVEPALAPLAEDGTAAIAYHPMPTKGDEGVRAAAAAACAYDAGRFREYREVLFAAQESDHVLTERRLLASGEAAGITDPAFADCVRRGTYVPWVRDRLDAGSRRGVVLTPTVFVDGEVVLYPFRTEELVATIRRAAATSS